MKTNAHKWKQKKKNQPDNGGGFNIRVRDDCFHPAINARTFTCHQDLPAFPVFRQRSRWCHAAFCQPAAFMSSAADASVVAAFSQQPSVDRRRGSLLPRGVFTCTHVSNGCPLLSVVWRIPPPWDHVYIVFNLGCLWVGGVDVGVACRRGGLSNTALSTTRRSRRRRRFPVIKSHACMARGLLVRQSLAIGVFSLIGHTTSIRAVVCLRLPVAIYVLFDAPAYRRFCGCMQCIYIFYLLVCLWFYHGMLMCIIYGLIVVRFPWFHWFFYYMINVIYYGMILLALGLWFCRWCSCFWGFCCVLILFGFYYGSSYCSILYCLFCLRIMYYIWYAGGVCFMG